MLVQTFDQIIACLVDAAAMVRTIAKFTNAPDMPHAPLDNSVGRGLVVLLHGLHGHVIIMERLQTMFTKKGFDVCAPRMFAHQLGLEQCGSQVMMLISPYLKKFGESTPVAFIGLSNGGRVACALEVKMREAHPTTPVMISSIAGVIGGTMLVNRADSLLRLIRLSSKVRKELMFNSSVSQRLISDMIQPLGPDMRRKFVFYATPQDQLVFPMSSSLPPIDKGEEHIIVQGCGHLSIMDLVHAHVCSSVHLFLKKYARQ